LSSAVRAFRSPLRLAVAAAVVCAGLALASSAAAQPPVPPARARLSVSAGVFRPSDAAFGRVYHGTKAPVVLQLDWRLQRYVAVFGGVRHLRTNGQAIVEDGGALARPDNEEFPARFRATSIRAGALLVWAAGPWDLRAGGGVNVFRYSEEWPAASFETTGSKTGWLAQASVMRAVTSRVSVGGGFEYSAAGVRQAGAGSLVPRIELGGLDLLAGIGIRF
jgi:hypothetical protein